jgi:hypothetical protein
MEWWWDLLKAMDAHEGQAAWAQGFFSVLAILAAIVIDQGAARRLREDRVAEKREAIADRRRALLNVAEAIESAAAQLQETTLVPRQFVALSEDCHRTLKAAEGLIDFYLRQGGEAGAHLAVALAHASEVIRRARSLTVSSGAINFNNRDQYVSLLREQSAVARDLVAKFDAGVW